MCTPVFGKCVLCSIPDAVVFQCTLVCRENDISRSEAVAAAVYRSKEVPSYFICDKFGLGVGGRYWVARTP